MRENPSQSGEDGRGRLYPACEPFAQAMMKVGGDHRIYVEQCGNPNGQPVIVLHGGPGGGCSPGMRRFFDPEHYRVILFDQRGCGRSTPYAEVKDNTTWDLVADIEQIRTAFGIDKWIVFGGSWGATLALIYAETHPERVQRLALRGVFLMTKGELDWFYGGGAAQFWPEEWAQLVEPLPAEERHDVIAAYHKRLFSDDHTEQSRFARLWAGWESALAALESPVRGLPSAHYARAFARLENHYFTHGGFLEEDGQILRDIDRIADIGGIIVHGRYDMICPPHMAYRLHAAWPASRLKLIARDGHALSEPGISAALVDYMDQLRTVKL